MYTYKNRLLKKIGPLKEKVVLDFGCGEGDYIELLLNEAAPPKAIYAVDSLPEMIDKIKQKFKNWVEKGLVIPLVAKDPKDLSNYKFDLILCVNTLECIYNKIEFINNFHPLLTSDGLFILAHHDFDSIIYNSSYKELTRHLIHHFADTQQDWQDYSDGQIGRKIPGLIEKSLFNSKFSCQTWRIVEKTFKEIDYGFLMANMLLTIGKKDKTISTESLHSWLSNLNEKANEKDYYFAIDFMVAHLKR